MDMRIDPQIEWTGIQSKYLDQFWQSYPIVEEWVDKSLAHDGGFLDVFHIKKAIRERDAQMWAFFDCGVLTAILITEIKKGVIYKSLNAVVVAGVNMPQWVAEMDELLNDYAKANDCDVITAFGRRGWQKTLKNLGWEDTTVTYLRGVK